MLVTRVLLESPTIDFQVYNLHKHQKTPLLYCCNSRTSLHFKILKSHNKTLEYVNSFRLCVCVFGYLFGLDQIGTHTHRRN